jgi:conjugal transfer/entry exclusion protein
MKRISYILLFGAMTCSPVSGQWAVFDIANLTQNVTNYAAMVEQIAKQAEQISNQLQQIKQMEDQLTRMGKMSDYKSLVGFPEFKLSVTLPTKVTTWADSVVLVDGAGLFGDSRDGIYGAVSSDFPDFDGLAVSRDPAAYKPAHEVTTKVNNFKEVQADVYRRREELKKAIVQTSDALQAADTEAEEQKLEAILNAQYSQLAALDSEVSLTAAEIQVKATEAMAMAEAHRVADAESRRRLAQQESKKATATFTPTYKCLLQYVSEKPYAP